MSEKQIEKWPLTDAELETCNRSIVMSNINGEWVEIPSQIVDGNVVWELPRVTASAMKHNRD